MKLLELFKSLSEDVTNDKAARQARAKSMGYDPDTVWYHANTGGIEGEGFDDDRLPTSDPDRPFNAHWFSSEPSEFAAYPRTGNVITPVHLNLDKSKEATHDVWRKVTRDVHRAWDAGDNERNAADMVREKLVSMGYTHAVRGREPIDAEELKRTGETKHKTSTGGTVTLKWEKVRGMAPHPNYTDEEMELLKTHEYNKRQWDMFHTLVIDHVMAKDEVTPEQREQMTAKGKELHDEFQRTEKLAELAHDRAYAEAAKQAEEFDSLEMYDDDIGHVTGYSDLADYEASHPEQEDIAVLDPSIIRSVHAEFNPDEAGSRKMMSSLGLNETRGPHEGKELELMLAGTKPLAMVELRREPEEKQAVWNMLIKQGRIIHRAGQTITTPQNPERHQNDFLALPGEEWRIASAQKLYDEVHRTNGMTDEHHIDLGNLLGYSPEDIEHFVTGFDAQGHDGFRDEDREMARKMGYKVNESQLDDDYRRGYHEGQIEGIKAGKEYRDSPQGREPEFSNFHVTSGRVTKANGYDKAYAYGYQDGYYTMLTGGDAEHLIGKIKSKLIGEDNQVWYHGGPPISPRDETIFFTTDEEGADWFTREKGGETKPYSINYRNALNLDNKAGTMQYFDIARKAGVDVQVTGEPFDRVNGWEFFSNDIAKHGPGYPGDNMHDLLYIPQFRAALRVAGYDAVKFSDALEISEIPAIVPLNKRMIVPLSEAAWNDSPVNENAQRRPPTVAYHATFPDNRDSIRLHGLDPKYDTTFEDGGAVYFATGATPDPKMDIWKADLSGLPMEYDNVQVAGETGWGENEHWWYTTVNVVPDRLKLVQKGKSGIIGEES